MQCVFKIIISSLLYSKDSSGNALRMTGLWSVQTGRPGGRPLRGSLCGTSGRPSPTELLFISKRAGVEPRPYKFIFICSRIQLNKKGGTCGYLHKLYSDITVRFWSRDRKMIHQSVFLLLFSVPVVQVFLCAVCCFCCKAFCRLFCHCHVVLG